MTQSAVNANERPFLHAWDTSARKYHPWFEAHKIAANRDIFKLKNNVLTNWRDAIQFRPRYEEADRLELRQMLGEISSSELAEVNSMFGGLGSVTFFMNKKEPAHLTAIPTMGTAFFFGIGGAMGLYGKFIRGNSFLWLGAALLPGTMYYLTAMAKQPNTELCSAYRYLLAKRAATCEMEANASAVAQSDFAQSKEYEAMSEQLASSGRTLYDMEADLVNAISSGQF